MINSNLDLSHQQQGGGVLCPVETKEGDGMEEEGGAQGEGREGREEAREVRAPPIPTTPSREEVLQHRLKHHPYRSWCPHCVRGKGREDKHTGSKQKDEYFGVPKISSDYFYIGQRRLTGREERR